MRLRLTARDDATIRRAAVAGYPRETCGFLLGARDREDALLEVRDIRPAKNRRGATAGTRYLIDPDAYRTAERSAEDRGLEIVGFWHSHPDAPAHPSAYDLDHAWPGVVYLIVAVENGRSAAATAWRLADDRSRFEQVSLETEPASLIHHRTEEV